MDIPKGRLAYSYYSELADNALALENLQHSSAFEAVVRENRVQTDVTHVQTKPERFHIEDLPVEFHETFFIPNSGHFLVERASLQEQLGIWNLNCWLRVNDTPHLITAQAGTTQVQTPSLDAEMLSRNFDGDFAVKLLSGLVLSSIRSKGVGTPPSIQRLKDGSEFQQLETILQSLGELNGFTHTQLTAAFESKGYNPGTEEQAELDEMNRVLFIKLSEVESMTSSAVSTSIDLGWQLIPDTTTRISAHSKEISQGSDSTFSVSGERQPVRGSLADFVLNKKLEGLLPPDYSDNLPRFLSPEVDSEEWTHAATALMKTLEPLLKRYAFLDE